LSVAPPLVLNSSNKLSITFTGDQFLSPRQPRSTSPQAPRHYRQEHSPHAHHACGSVCPVAAHSCALDCRIWALYMCGDAFFESHHSGCHRSWRILISSTRKVRERDVPLRGPFDSNPNAQKIGVVARLGSRMTIAFTECSTVCAGCARTSARKTPWQDISRTCSCKT
jgi:hypothetical protein